MNDLRVDLLPPSKPAVPELSFEIRLGREPHTVQILFFTPDGCGSQAIRLAADLPSQVVRNLGQTLLAYAIEADR